ncbi:MAG: hypothetical protein A4E55_01657 [Pelotomaculum sp. PtaU1.Bin035]|nr:MAG: hypothetical protein A4E55_01657 [Pelotomaculum sp. PtaU1.Bin035]
MALKYLRRNITLSLFLILLSLLLYLTHFLLFGDIHHILIYFIGDLAFLPIEVLLVTLIFHRLLNEREKRVMLKKLYMVIGAFYSEVGTWLLKFFASAGSHSENLIIKDHWSEQDFNNADIFIKNYCSKIDSANCDLVVLRGYLIEKRDFLLRLLENPNLLENESFTELLWAVFHLTEELVVRQNIKQLSHTDSEHLSIDINRAYISLILEWLQYMKHLKENYPYLFSLALRTNPYDPDASPVFK